MAKIKPEDIEKIQEWRKLGYLVDFDESVKQTNGVELVMCADGDQMHDFFGHQAEFNKRLHLLTHHGGACILGMSQLDNERRRLLLKDLRDGVTLKRVDAIGLAAHYPCGWAQSNNFTIEQQMVMLTEAYKVAEALFICFEQNTFPPQQTGAIKIIPMLHVDYGDGDKRTYVVDLNKVLK